MEKCSNIKWNKKAEHSGESQVRFCHLIELCSVSDFFSLSLYVSPPPLARLLLFIYLNQQLCKSLSPHLYLFLSVTHCFFVFQSVSPYFSVQHKIQTDCLFTCINVVSWSFVENLLILCNIFAFQSLPDWLVD